MNCVVRHEDLRQRNELFGLGQKSRSMQLREHEEGDLDDATCMIETNSPFGQWERVTTAVLRTPTLLGFGAMVGIDSQLEQLFPMGTDFVLRTRPDSSTHIRIGTENACVMVEALASGLKGREDEGLWVLTLESDPAVLDNPALASIQNPTTLLSAAAFTLQLAERAITE